ncbi:MAG: hypothetical protein ACTSVI_01830 [Promethearchaeota archaeon]
MKFVKGFITTIAVYFGLSLIFSILAMINSGNSIADLFSDMNNLASIFYQYQAIPSITTSFMALIALIVSSDIGWLIIFLSSIVPISIAPIIGSIAEGRSGSVKHIFSATFLGLFTCSAIGVLIQVISWPDGGVNLNIINGSSSNMELIYIISFMNSAVTFPYWQWFLPAALGMSALNGFIWCSVGLMITSKKWD